MQVTVPATIVNPYDLHVQNGGSDGTNRDEAGSTVSSSYLAGYDPTSGLAYGAGGSPLQLRQSGGQAQALGKDSWTWLLLGPMSR